MSGSALFAILAAATLAASGARAQGLSDPTRPPNAPMAGEPQEASPGGTQLQSILISSSRRLAIINGTTVPLGGTIGDATVIKITETEVTLQKGTETEVLKLYPGVDKQPVKRATRARVGAASGQLQGRSK